MRYTFFEGRGQKAAARAPEVSDRIKRLALGGFPADRSETRQRDKTEARTISSGDAARTDYCIS
jgi:hypothetical protein